MQERTKERLRSLFGKRAIPPWLLIAWSIVNFGSNVQFLVGAWAKAWPFVEAMNGPVQASLLMISGFAWLGVLVLRGDEGFDVERLHSLSNARLRKRAIEHAQAMRSFEAIEQEKDRRVSSVEWHAMPRPATPEESSRKWHQDGIERDARRAALDREYKTRFHGYAKALYEELKARHGISGNSDVPSALEFGMLAGVNPILEAADYLEKLARELK
jgi:hypothetical protein